MRIRSSILIGIFLLTLTQTLLAQKQSENEVLLDNDLASIVANRIDCIDERNGTAKAYVTIELTNRSDQSISISFKKNMWYDGKCINCNSESEEYRVSKQLAPRESMEGNCETNNGLRLFSSMKNLENTRQLTDFELSDIQVSKL